jgi:hypothetical protein
MNYCYIVQEREHIRTNENIYKIGKTKQENLKRIQNYPNGSKLIIQIEVIDCDIFEKEIIQKFKEKYEQKKLIGTEYFEGNKSEMINDYIHIYNDFEKSQITTKCQIYKKISGNITDENQIIYYPYQELNKLIDLFDISIDYFNEKNGCSMKFTNKFMNDTNIQIYWNILNYYFSNSNNCQNDVNSLIELKNNIKNDIIENNIIIFLINYIQQMNTDQLQNINLQINIINNAITFKRYYNGNFIYDEKILSINLFEKILSKNDFYIEMENENITENDCFCEKFDDKLHTKIYNEIYKQGIVNFMIKIKNKNFDEKLFKNIVLEKYYEKNDNFIRMNENIEKNIITNIQKEIKYEIISDGEQYIGLKYFNKGIGSRLITNISSLDNLIQEDLEGWIVNNSNIYNNDFSLYYYGLNINFTISCIINNSDYLIEIYKNKEHNLDIDEKLDNCDINFNIITNEKYIIKQYDNLFIEINKCNFDETNNKYEYDITHELFKIQNEQIEKIILKQNKNNITQQLLLNNKMYDQILSMNNKYLKKEFKKKINILKYHEYTMSISTYDDNEIIYIMYDTLNKQICDKNKYCCEFGISNINSNRIGHSTIKKCSDLNEFDNILKILNDNQTYENFKQLCKSVLIENKSMKCIINKYNKRNMHEYNIGELLIWTLSKINCHVIEINNSDDITNIDANKLIVLKICKGNDKILIERVMKKYSINNIIIVNRTRTNININDYQQINYLEHAKSETMDKYIKSRDENNYEGIEMEDFFESQTSIFMDWVIGENILSNYISKINLEVEIENEKKYEEFEKKKRLHEIY